MYQTVEITSCLRAVNCLRQIVLGTEPIKLDKSTGFQTPLCMFLRLIEHSEVFVTSVDTNSFLGRSLELTIWTRSLTG